MPCFHPLKGYRLTGGGLTQNKAHSATHAPMTVPCGQCIGCRQDRARDWSVRIRHEATLHDESSFLTLTYSDEHLPANESVNVRDLQLFFKRLRKQIEPTKVRYYACGEYGDETRRPHYHAIVFGYDFPDKKKYRKSKTGHILYRSETLDGLWPSGQCDIGNVTRETGSYVARYCLKKVTGPPSEAHYGGRQPEFAVMSTRPGIGYGWFQKYESDAFPSAFIVLNGQKYPVPRYYKSKLRSRYEFDQSNPNALLEQDDLYETRKMGRKYLLTHPEDITDERLAVREEVRLLKQAKIGRG